MYQSAATTTYINYSHSSVCDVVTHTHSNYDFSFCSSKLYS